MRKGFEAVKKRKSYPTDSELLQENERLHGMVSDLFE